MIKLSVFYPAEAGSRFDVDYYCNHHMPLVQKTFGAICKGVAVDFGLAGRASGAPPTYVAIGHVYFDSVEEFETAFARHRETFRADMPNYTDIRPLMQISEVKI